MNWANHQIEAPAVGGAGSGGFAEDPERAQACIAELTRIVNDLRLEIMSLAALRFDAPGSDAVSRNLAANGREMGRRAEIFVRA